MKSFRTGCFLAVVAIVAPGQTYNLSVPLRTQEHSQWCWAGASQMVLWYKGQTPTQCSIANYALGINYACGNSNFYWSSYANQPNSVGAISNILNAWGVSSSYYRGYPYWSTLTSYINNRKPFVILKTWRNGGGHFVVGKGYSGSSVYVNDPWPGNGSSLQSYSYLRSSGTHYWSWTNYLR